MTLNKGAYLVISGTCEVVIVPESFSRSCSIIIETIDARVSMAFSRNIFQAYIGNLFLKTFENNVFTFW